MPLPNIFANELTPQMVELDQNFAAVGACVSVPCSVSGTNALTLTPQANTPDNSVLANYSRWTGIVANTNTTAVTAAVAGNSPLSVFKDTQQGPKALQSGDLRASCAFVLTYDSALSSGAGGFHLQTGASVLTNQTVTMQVLAISTGNQLFRMLTFGTTVTFTVIPANSTQDQNASIAGLLTSDQIYLTPPSLTSGLIANAWVPANGTLTVRYANVTAASIAAPGAQVHHLTLLGFL